MTNERDIVLSGIRRSLGRSPEAVRSGAAARHEGATDGALATGAPHPAPSRVANASQAELIDIFIAQLESQGVRAVRCPNDASVPRAVADVLEEFGLDAPGESADDLWCVAVSLGKHHPFLLVTQRYSPGSLSGFVPDALLVSESKMLFLGAGERLLAYDLASAARLWQGTTDPGFWGWARHGDVVIMSAELELAAYSLQGEKLWTSFVDPPWTYTVEGDVIMLNVMGSISQLSLERGPA